VGFLKIHVYLLRRSVRATRVGRERTVKASATATASEQGVRHEAPVEIPASAPGGSDSIVKVAVAGLDPRCIPG
jgi:hypothetical protein